MLEVFQRQNITNFVCVVTRYFGGILLGAGGLLRAYTKSAKDALDAAGVSVVRRWVELGIPCSYSQFERLRLETEAFDGIITEIEYGADVTIMALIPEERSEEFAAHIYDMTGGTVSVIDLGEAFRPVKIR